MYIPMLEAISEMLVLKNNDQAIDAERVACAKIMLDKIIEGMKATPDDYVAFKWENDKKELVKSDSPILMPAPKPKPKPKSKPDDIGIEVNNGFITKVTNAKENTMIQLDGRAYPWRKTIGMSFTEGKVL